MELKSGRGSTFAVHRLSVDESRKNSWNVCAIAANPKPPEVKEVTATVLSLGARNAVSPGELSQGSLGAFRQAFNQLQNWYLDECRRMKRAKIDFERGEFPQKVWRATKLTPTRVPLPVSTSDPTTSVPQLPDITVSMPLAEVFSYAVEIDGDLATEELDSTSVRGPLEIGDQVEAGWSN